MAVDLTLQLALFRSVLMWTGKEARLAQTGRGLMQTGREARSVPTGRGGPSLMQTGRKEPISTQTGKEAPILAPTGRKIQRDPQTCKADVDTRGHAKDNSTSIEVAVSNGLDSSLYTFRKQDEISVRPVAPEVCTCIGNIS